MSLVDVKVLCSSDLDSDSDLNLSESVFCRSTCRNVCFTYKNTIINYINYLISNQFSTEFLESTLITYKHFVFAKMI